MFFSFHVFNALVYRNFLGRIQSSSRHAPVRSVVVTVIVVQICAAMDGETRGNDNQVLFENCVYCTCHTPGKVKSTSSCNTPRGYFFGSRLSQEATAYTTDGTRLSNDKYTSLSRAVVVGWRETSTSAAPQGGLEINSNQNLFNGMRTCMPEDAQYTIWNGHIFCLKGDHLLPTCFATRLNP